jgi:hypothetical protein
MEEIQSQIEPGLIPKSHQSVSALLLAACILPLMGGALVQSTRRV